MSSRPRLIRSIPFWLLTVGSLASAGGGAALFLARSGTMTTTLTDGSATGVDVYVGQVEAVLGAVLIGAGIVGLALALALAAARSLVPAAPVAAEPAIPADSLDAAPETIDTPAAAVDAEPAAARA